MPIFKNPIVKLLQAPKVGAETVTEGKMGEEVEIVNDLETFYEVRTLWDNYPGFVPKEKLLNLDWQVKDPLITASLSTCVYEEARVQAPMLFILPLGIKVKPLSENLNERWIKVELPSRTIGFIQKGDLVSASKLSFDSIPKLRASLIAWAIKFENAVPYIWGGGSSFGTDCSGFVQHLYRLHNLPLERDASQQGLGRFLSTIKRDEVLPGDLLFFTNFGHVGMALSHFAFIHATTEPRPVVQVSQIDDPNWLEKTIQYSRYKF